MDAFLIFAWAWILLGLAAGVGFGLFFATDDWLGGYAAWPRRLLRLGHVAFVGTGLLALGAHWTLQQVPTTPSTAAAVRTLFVAGALLMPTVCFLAACWKPLRHAFVAPVASLGGGVATLLVLAAHGS